MRSHYTFDDYFNREKEDNKEKEREKEDNDIEVEQKKLYTRGLTGLENLGNTCYMNSILQCLFAIPVFNAYMIDNDSYQKLYSNMLENIGDAERIEKSIPNNISVKVPRKKLENACENTITYGLSELFTEMWKYHRTVTPASFKKIIGNYCKTFNGYSQNDSQELLNLILDKIHDEMKTPVKVIFQNIPDGVNNYISVKKQCTEYINSNDIALEEKQKYSNYLHEYSKQHIDDKITSDAYIYWRSYIKKSHSIITDLFTGLFYSKIVCTECNCITGSFEPFNILTLSTKDNEETTLIESLDTFCKEELLTGDEKYFCPECKKKTDALKSMRIWSPPNILIIQLKRFKNDSYQTTKTSSKVMFPIKNMDINDYLSDLHPVDKTTYELVAISEHRGTCDTGHYVAYCKNAINNKWYEFNDEDIFHIPYEDLDKELITKNAYILFYIRNIN